MALWLTPSWQVPGTCFEGLMSYMFSHAITGWWFGTFFIFPYIGFLIIPIDFHIFQRGGPTTNQITCAWKCSSACFVFCKFWYFMSGFLFLLLGFSLPPGRHLFDVDFPRVIKVACAPTFMIIDLCVCGYPCISQVPSLVRSTHVFITSPPVSTCISCI